jgi:hypothetical protein
MFADSEEAPCFRIEEPSAPVRSDAGAKRLTLLLAMAGLLLLATAVLRSWTVVKNAADPPVKFYRPGTEPTAPPSHDDERVPFTFPPPPRI